MRKKKKKEKLGLCEKAKERRGKKWEEHRDKTDGENLKVVREDRKEKKKREAYGKARHRVKMKMPKRVR